MGHWAVTFQTVGLYVQEEETQNLPMNEKRHFVLGFFLQLGQRREINVED